MVGIDNIKLLFEALSSLRSKYRTQSGNADASDISDFAGQVESYVDTARQTPDEISEYITTIHTTGAVRLLLQSLISKLIADSVESQGGFNIEEYNSNNASITQGSKVIYLKDLPFGADCTSVFQECVNLMVAPDTLDYSSIEIASSMFRSCTALVVYGVLYMPICRMLNSIFDNSLVADLKVYAPCSFSAENINDNKIKTLDTMTLVFGRFNTCNFRLCGVASDKIELDYSRTTELFGFSRNSLNKNYLVVAPYFRITNNTTRIRELFYEESSTAHPILYFNGRHWNTINLASWGSIGQFRGYAIGLFSVVSAYGLSTFNAANNQHIYLMGDDADSGLHFSNTAHEGTALTLSDGVVYGTYSPQGLQSGDTYLNTDTMECFSYDGTRWNYERTIHPDMVGLQYGISHGAKGTAIELQNGNPVVVDAGALASALPNLKLGDTYLNTETFDAFVYTDDFTLCHGLLNSTYAGTAVRRDWNSTSKVYEITDTSGLTPAEGDTYYNTETDQYFTYTNGAWVWRQASRWDVENAHWHRNCQVNPTKPNRKWFYVHYADDGVATTTTIRNDKVQSCAGDSPRSADNEYPVANWGTAAARNPHWEWRCKSVIERHMTLTGANITAQSLCNLIRHVHINEDNELEGVIFTLNRNTYNNYAQGAMQDFTAETPRRTTTVTGTYAAQAQAVLDALWDNADNTDWLQFNPPS